MKIKTVHKFKKHPESYKEALENTSLSVQWFYKTTNYQGEWLALVKQDDKPYWVGGSYGSCSGCDALHSICDYEEEVSAAQQQQYIKYLKDLDLMETLDTVDMKWSSDNTELLRAVKDLYDNIKFINDISLD